MGHVGDDDVVAIGQRMPRIGNTLLRRVVLHEHHGNVDARLAAGQTLDEVELLQALQHHGVERSRGELGLRHIHHGGGPVAGAHAALARRIHRQEVRVPSAHERVHPPAVHLPDDEPQSAAHS